MANPNEITKVLNEMMRTLEQLSDAQLESVQSIVEEQTKANENRKILEAKQRTLDNLKNRNYISNERVELQTEKKKIAIRDTILDIVNQTNTKIEKFRKISIKDMVGITSVSNHFKEKKTNLFKRIDDTKEKIKQITDIKGW